MISKLKSLNLVLIAFLAYSIKLLIVSSSFADGIVLAVLAGALSYSSYLKSIKKKELDQDELKDVKEDVQELKSSLSSLNIAKIKPDSYNKKYF